MTPFSRLKHRKDLFPTALSTAFGAALLATIGAVSCQSVSPPEADTDVEETPEKVAAAAAPVEATPGGAHSTGFAAFESGQVRPLALTPDKKLLLATNTPDGKLEIYKVKNHGL